MASKQELRDVLRQVQNERKSTNLAEALLPEPSLNVGSSFGIVFMILLLTVIPFVLSAGLAALWEFNGTAEIPAVKMTNGEMLMWFAISYTIIAVITGFIWYGSRKSS